MRTVIPNPNPLKIGQLNPALNYVAEDIGKQRFVLSNVLMLTSGNIVLERNIVWTRCQPRIT